MITPKFLTELAILEDGVNDQGEPWWFLTAPLEMDSAIFGGRIIVEAGFRTDLSSIPRWPYVYWRLGGRGRRAGAIHDKGYRTHGWGRYPGEPEKARAMCDGIWAEAVSISENLPADLRWAAWAGLRIGGWKAWADQP